MKQIRKTNSIKAKGKSLKVLIFLAISAIVAFLLTLRPVAEEVEKVTGWNDVQGVAVDVMYVLIGLVLFWIASLFAVFPVVMAVIGLIGLALIIPVVYKYFIANNQSAE